MTIDQVWADVIGVQSDPPDLVVLGAAVAALLLVAWRSSWMFLRGVVTIAHEGGHAFAAAVTGRRLLGVRLHSDTSGLTLSAGKPTGVGMALTLFAGYVTPSLLGLGGVALLRAGRITLLLWLSILLLALMLLLIRNLYGVVSVVGTGAVIFALSWFAPADTQAAFGYFAVCFLLVAAPRPVAELVGMRRRMRSEGGDSDADQLGRITGVPAGLWLTLFGLLTLAAAFGGGYWLLPVPP